MGYNMMAENAPTSHSLISRQAAIDAVADLYAIHGSEGSWIDLKDALNAIRNLPSVQPEYKLDEWCETCKEYDHEKHCCPRFNRVIRNALNEAQPERKKGKWMRDEFGSKCSVCGLYAYKDKFDRPWESPYCPNCGSFNGGGYDADGKVD